MNVPLPETTKFVPTPADLLALAAECPEVTAAIREWKSGKLTWEQALIRALLDSNRVRRILNRVFASKDVLTPDERDRIKRALGMPNFTYGPEPAILI